MKTGDYVKRAQLSVSSKLPKATFEVEASANGYAHFFVSENDEIKVGKPFCIISEGQKLESNQLEILNDEEQNKYQNESNDLMISKSAQELIQKHR